MWRVIVMLVIIAIYAQKGHGVNMGKYLNFVTLDDVETQVHPWGILQWLSEPRVTGTGNMTTGLVTVEPGQGHARHNHEGCEEILYFLEGEGLQTLELPDGAVQRKMKASELVFIPAGAFHSTINVGDSRLAILAIYQFAGPEAGLRADPLCKVLPPKNTA